MIPMFVILVDLLNLILEVSSQDQHNMGNPMELYESRWANITRYPGDRCRLDNQRYYLKKRLTRRRINGRNLRYQFIASSGYLYDDPMDPPPLPGEPDHFASQYGWIFCERGVIMGLEMKPNARYCGIEHILVAACLIDRDVNPGDDINLDISRLMPNVSNVVNSGHFGVLVNTNCYKLIAVRLPPLQEELHYDASRFQRLYGFINPQQVFGWSWTLDLLNFYLEGAYMPLEGADNVVLKERCGTYVSWRNYHIEDFTLNPEFTLNTYQKTVGRSWYLCLPIDGDSRNDLESSDDEFQ